MQTVVAHPTNSNILYIGTANGGIWRTTDANDASPNWTPLADSAKSLSISTLSLDPTDPNGMTLVAGEGRRSDSSRAGGLLDGLLYSDDGGATWTPLDGGGTLTGKDCSGIAVRGKTIVVSVDNAETGSYADVGIFRSTDGGKTFTQISNGNGVLHGLPEGIAYDLAADPLHSNILYTAVVGADGYGGANGIYKSTNTCATWTKVSQPTLDGYLNSTGNSVTHNVQMSVGRSGQLYVGVVNQDSANAGQDRLAAVFRFDGVNSWMSMDLPQTVDSGVANGIELRRPLPGRRSPRHSAQRQGLGRFLDRCGPQQCEPRLCRRRHAAGHRCQIVDRRHRLLPASVPRRCLESQRIAVGSLDGFASEGPDRRRHRQFVIPSCRFPRHDLRCVRPAHRGRPPAGIYYRSSPQDNTGQWYSLNGNLQVTEVQQVAYDSISNIAIAAAPDVGLSAETAAGSSTWSEIEKGDGGEAAVDDASLAGSNQSYRYTSGQYLNDFKRQTVDANNTVIATTMPAAIVVNGSGGKTFSAVDGGQATTPVVINSVDPTRMVIGGAPRPYMSRTTAPTRNLCSAPSQTPRRWSYGGYRDDTPYPDVSGPFGQRRLSATELGQPIGENQLWRQHSCDIAVDSTDWEKAFVIDDSNVYYTSDAE